MHTFKRIIVLLVEYAYRQQSWSSLLLVLFLFLVCFRRKPSLDWKDHGVC